MERARPGTFFYLATRPINESVPREIGSMMES